MKKDFLDGFFKRFPVSMAVFWQSKLKAAEELSRFALFLHSAPVSEASVERTNTEGSADVALLSSAVM